MKLIFDYKFRFYTSKMNEICLHCHWLYFSSIILSYGQCGQSLIRNFIWKHWVACAWGQKVSTCIFFLAMQWKKFSIHLETDGSFRLPVSKLNNTVFFADRCFLSKKLFFFQLIWSKAFCQKNIFILVKQTWHCLSKYKPLRSSVSTGFLQHSD